LSSPPLATAVVAATSPSEESTEYPRATAATATRKRGQARAGVIPEARSARTLGSSKDPRTNGRDRTNEAKTATATAAAAPEWRGSHPYDSGDDDGGDDRRAPARRALAADPSRGPGSSAAWGASSSPSGRA